MTKKDYICIDLGAKYTGVFLAHTENSNLISSEGFTIINDPNNITWSQEARRTTRHRVRALKRRKLAKRLFWEIAQTIKINFTKDEINFLNGLFNRRGYTYKNIDEVSIEENPVFDNREFINSLNIFENISFENESLLDFFEKIANESKDDKNKLQTLLKNIEDLDNFKLIPLHQEEYNEIKSLFEQEKIQFKNNGIILNEDIRYNTIFKNKNIIINADVKNKFKKIQKAIEEKQIKKFENVEEINFKDYSKVLSEFKEFVSNLIKEIEEGHKHRKVYLKNIEKDINNSNINFGMERKQIFNLIGNISNFQLRLLRKYFNDKFDNKFDDKKLKYYFINWVKSWRTTGNEEAKNNQKEILKNIDNIVVDFLIKLDPFKTIPPFEDQDNRHPQKDATLFINEQFLDNNFSFWRQLLKCFIEKDENLLENLDEIINKSNFNRKYLLDKDGVILQRLFDRNTILDKFKFRTLVNLYSNNKLMDSEEFLLLKNKISASDDFLIKLIEIGKKYYNEVEMAKQGLWQKSDESILKRIDLNCPKIKNCTELLLSSIFGKNINSNEVISLKSFLKDNKVKPDLPGVRAKSILSWAKDCKDAQKDYGTYLNKKIIEINIKSKYRDIEKNTDEYELYKLILAVEQAENFIIKNFFKDEKTRDFGNIYSFSQIYSFIEGDTHGFYNSSKPTAIENSWRDKTIKTIDNKTGEEIFVSNASRLPKDSVRPFDGQLGAIIERTSYEIYKKYFDFSKKSEVDELQILIEENNFEFERDLKKDIKKNIKKIVLDKITKKLNANKKTFNNRLNEIKMDSKGICPYTGNTLTNNGEIDHIIPRSASKKFGKTVFNSRLNLIYASSTGNRQKGNKIYTYKNLHANFLNRIFNTTDIQQIETDINNKLNNIIKKFGNTIITSDLEQDERIVLRMALFSENEEIKRKAYELLHTKSKTMVNGTQAYLCKNIIGKIKNNLKVSDIKVKKIQVDDIKIIRDNIPVEFSELKKEEHQSPYSHIIDATSVFCYDFKQINPEIKLEKIVPADFSFIDIKSKNLKDKTEKGGKSLLNDSIYSERYLSIFLKDNLAYAGFSLDNSEQIDTNKEKCLKFLEEINQFLEFKNTSVNNLDDFFNTSNDNLIYFTLNKKKIQDYYHEKARKNEKVNEKIEKNLSKLRFYTKRKNIEDIFDIKFSENDEIKVAFNSKVKFDFKFNKKLISIPVKNQIFSVLNFILKQINEKVQFKNQTEIIESIISYLQKEYNFFLRDNKNNEHIKVRKVFSIPVIDGPSGGIRIKRKTPLNESVYQIQATNNTIGQYAGFDKDFNEINHPHFIKNSKKTSYISGNNSEDVFFKFGECYNLNLDDKYKNLYSEIICTLNSGSRQEIILKIPEKIFIEKYLPEIDGIENNINLSNLPEKLKFAKNFPISDISPREGNTSFKGVINRNIILNFTTSGTNQYLKEKIKNAKKIIC